MDVDEVEFPQRRVRVDKTQRIVRVDSTLLLPRYSMLSKGIGLAPTAFSEYWVPLARGSESRDRICTCCRLGLSSLRFLPFLLCVLVGH